MRLISLFLSALMVLYCSISATASDDIQGTLIFNGKSIPITHVHALLHDNAEGLLPSPTQLRILLSDGEVQPEALWGLSFLPVAEMGLLGTIRGVLLQFDPNNFDNVDLTVLMGPDGLQTVSNRVMITDLRLTDEKVSGAVEYADDDRFAPSDGSSPIVPIVKFKFRFLTEINREPAVTAELKGKAALKSPQVKVLTAIAGAITRGDLAALQKLTTADAGRRNKEQFDLFGPKRMSILRRIGTELRRAIPKVNRIVVRGNRAVVIFKEKGSYSSFVLEGGAWKGN